jgi:hypothetical protein
MTKQTYLKNLRGLVCMGLLLSCETVFAARILAQAVPAPGIEHLKSILKNLNKIPARNRARLSPGLQTFMRMATAEVAAAQSPAARTAKSTALLLEDKSQIGPVPEQVTAPEGLIRVSDPMLDFLTSSIAGFSQFQSSTAWCGNNIVVAYTDTGAALRASGNSSLDGISISNDNGRTFSDLGVINTNPLSANNDQLLTGNSVAACSSEQFHYASTGFNDVESGGGSAILISHSAGTNLSQWTPPSPAIAKGDSEFTLDMPWLAVDPSNPQQLYLTYTSFDNSYGGGPPFCEFAQTLELISSSDSGFTWSMPLVLDTECEGGEFGVSSGFSISGSNVVVSPGGKVYVVYLAFGSPSEIRFLASNDHGQTFGATQRVAAITPAGSTVALQGNIRPDTLPTLAVDRSSGSGRETLYLAWVQGDHAVIVGGSAYAYGDVVVAKSTNFGANFTLLGPISPTPKHFAGKGRDQFTPGIAVDLTGIVQICYYDRRNDQNNIAIDRYCSDSRNQGRTWIEQRASRPHWLPFYGDSIQSGLGIFDTVASDFLQQNVGFMAAFEFINFGNPDIVGKRLGEGSHE